MEEGETADEEVGIEEEMLLLVSTSFRGFVIVVGNDLATAIEIHVDYVHDDPDEPETGSDSETVGCLHSWSCRCSVVS